MKVGLIFGVCFRGFGERFSFWEFFFVRER